MLLTFAIDIIPHLKQGTYIYIYILLKDNIADKVKQESEDYQ